MLCEESRLHIGMFLHGHQLPPSSLSASPMLTGKRTLKCWKRPLSPVHCHRRESGTMSSYMKNNLSLSFLSSCPLPSHGYLQIATAMRIRAVLLPATHWPILLSSLINVSRSPPANFWPYLRITWNTSLKQWYATQTSLQPVGCWAQACCVLKLLIWSNKQPRWEPFSLNEHQTPGRSGPRDGSPGL